MASLSLSLVSSPSVRRAQHIGGRTQHDLRYLEECRKHKQSTSRQGKASRTDYVS